jgi:energy-coupling factor transporter ATP-binding protein EcfA2
LYAAFRRRLAKAEQETLPWSLWALIFLLFLTAMLVNSAGSFVSVVEATRLDSLSFAAIAEGFGNLPATSQAALIMAVLSAFIIPIGALVAGDGLAVLTLERRTGNDFREERWQEVEFTVIYRAVFVRYFHQALQERDACQRAYTSTAMVFQDYALFPHLTVRDNVGYGLRLAKVARTEIQRRVHETLDFL